MPQVVVVGAACRDLVDDDPRGWRLGGGASYSALALARLGLRGRGARRRRRPAADADGARPAARGRRRPAARPPGARARCSSTSRRPGGASRSRRRSRTRSPVAALPDAWRLGAGMDVRAGRRRDRRRLGGRHPPRDALVAVGWQGLLRVLVARRAGRAPVEPAASPLVARADLVGVGRRTTSRRHAARAPGRVRRPGRHAAGHRRRRAAGRVDRGRRPTGRRSARSRWTAIPIRRLVDPTGAGDTFLAGVLAARLDPSILGGRDGAGPDLRFGAAAASLVVRGPGLLGVPSLDEVLERLDDAADCRWAPRRMRAARAPPQARREPRARADRGPPRAADAGRPVSRSRSSSRHAARVAASAPLGVAEPVLAQLRDLDPGDRARAGRRPRPRSATPPPTPPSGRAGAAPAPAPRRRRSSVHRGPRVP